MNSSLGGPGCEQRNAGYDGDRFRPLPLESARSFAVPFHRSGNPAALQSARGRTLTSWPSIRRDLVNAGAEWLNEEVVVDHGLITSRKPSDIPAFATKLVEEIAEGIHMEQAVKSGASLS